MTATALPFMQAPTAASRTPGTMETPLISMAAVAMQLVLEDLSAPLPSSANFAGEQFRIEQEDGFVYIVHPRWSLVGAGESYVTAVQDLRSEAKALAEAMAGDDPATLTPEARSMREFVRKGLR